VSGWLEDHTGQLDPATVEQLTAAIAALAAGTVGVTHRRMPGEQTRVRDERTLEEKIAEKFADKEFIGAAVDA
jgi:hypothetical protein